MAETRGHLKESWVFPRDRRGCVLATLHALPWVFPNILHIMIMIFLFSLLGQGWNVLGGYAGQFSFGHSLFFGDHVSRFCSSVSV
jgi:ABC-type branched-subunit amino acid transport system permease subunit